MANGGRGVKVEAVSAGAVAGFSVSDSKEVSAYAAFLMANSSCAPPEWSWRAENYSQ
jgi:hypothetical protein